MSENFIRTGQGQAWDQIAKSRYASEKSMGVLLPANADEMDCLIFSGEIELKLPQIKVEPVRSLPPWERLS